MLRYRHVGITVSDLERSISFYTKAFGFALKFRVTRNEPFIQEIVGMPGIEIEIAMLVYEDLNLELLHYKGPRWIGGRGSPHSPANDTSRAGHVHLCFEVGMFEMTEAKLYGLGAFKVGSATIPDGPQKGAITGYFKGLDGETIEIFQAPQP